jgi:hypothetical protein
MNIGTVAPAMTYDGLPIGVDTFFEDSNMAAATYKDICMRGEVVQNERRVQMYYTVTLVFNSDGKVIKQCAAVATSTPPSWLASATGLL